MQPCSLIAKWRGHVSNSWLCLVEALEPCVFQTKDAFGLAYIESEVERYAGIPAFTEIHQTLLPPFLIVSHYSNFLGELKYFKFDKAYC